MAEQSEFMATVLKLLTPLGEVTSKRMFGGYGVFLEASMFALVSKNDELFLKADEVNKAAFVARGSKTHGKMPYYAAPPETLKGWGEMESWARGAVEAAGRAKKK
jgi:DNA transformation protein